MTQGFDEWMNKKTPYGNVSIRQAFKAGQQSRQAEIDELQKRIDKAINLIEPSDEISHKLYREIVKTLRGK